MGQRRSWESSWQLFNKSCLALEGLFQVLSPAKSALRSRSGLMESRCHLLSTFYVPCTRLREITIIIPIFHVRRLSLEELK